MDGTVDPALFVLLRRVLTLSLMDASSVTPLQHQVLVYGVARHELLVHFTIHTVGRYAGQSC